MRLRPLALPLLIAATALTPLTPATAISGGQEVNSDYIVQLHTQREDGEYDRCTASAISPQWIITAAHCIEDAADNSSAAVYFSNDRLNPGQPIYSSKIIESPEADLALIQLSTPKELASYAQLASDHHFTAQERGYIYGYGRGNKGETMPWLRRAEVEQSHESKDAYWNDVYRLTGIDGTSNNGDSGGPFMVNDKLVGINVSGSHAANDYWVGETSGALQLRPFIPWIQETSGVTALPFAAVPPAPAPSPDINPEPTASPTPSSSPSASPTPSAQASETASPTASPSPIKAQSPTASPTAIPTSTTSFGPFAPSPQPSTSIHTPLASSSPEASASNQQAPAPSAAPSNSAKADATPTQQAQAAPEQTSAPKKFTLAHTGASTLPLLALAGTLCLAGAIFTLRTRTRR